LANIISSKNEILILNISVTALLLLGGTHVKMADAFGDDLFDVFEGKSESVAEKRVDVPEADVRR
jgi:hypothetical protein